MKDLVSYTINCCEEMRGELLCRGGLVAIYDRIDNKPLLTPQAFIISDGGHGGMAPAKFCPFCGKKIEIVATKTISE